MNAGKLVPDELVVEIATDRLDKDDLQGRIFSLTDFQERYSS